MVNITIEASKRYEVVISRGLHAKCGNLLLPVLEGASVLALITDSKVEGYYAGKVRASLEDAGFKVIKYVLEEGEQSKSSQNFAKIISWLADNRVGRKDAIVALGGGMVGDIAGFAAATYRRGIRYVQMPTTLLAAVDSSVGGKTAVDMPQGKNLVGAFYQPEMVICDTDSLRTLDKEDFISGCAEVIKYGVLGSEEFLCELAELTPEEMLQGSNLEHVIETCVRMKRDIVKEDELDQGVRAKLNLGHTFGHAVESLENYELSHGKSVAIGLAMICRSAASKGMCDSSVPETVVGVLEQYGLPTSTDHTREEIYSAALSDKKVSGGNVSLIVPTAIGDCKIVTMKQEEMLDWI